MTCGPRSAASSNKASPAEAAAKQADLTKHKEHFPTIQGPGVPVIAVTRIYELLDRGAAK